MALVITIIVVVREHGGGETRVECIPFNPRVHVLAPSFCSCCHLAVVVMFGVASLQTPLVHSRDSAEDEMIDCSRGCQQ